MWSRKEPGLCPRAAACANLPNQQTEGVPALLLMLLLEGPQQLLQHHQEQH